MSNGQSNGHANLGRATTEQRQQRTCPAKCLVMSTVGLDGPTDRPSNGQAPPSLVEGVLSLSGCESAELNPAKPDSECECGHAVIDHHHHNYRRGPGVPAGDRGHGKCTRCPCVACQTASPACVPASTSKRGNDPRMEAHYLTDQQQPKGKNQ